MLRHKAETTGALFCLVDLAILSVASVATYALRSVPDAAFPDFRDYVPLFGLLVSTWLVLLYKFGLYEEPRGGGQLRRDLVGIFKVGFLGFFFAATLIFGLKLHFVSRLLVGLYSIVACLLLAVERCIMRYVIARTAAAERNILVIGRGTQVERVRELLRGEEHWGVRVVEPAVGDVLCSTPTDTAAALQMLLTTTIVDEVIFAVGPADLQRIEESLLVCERLGVNAHVSLSLENMHVAKAQTTDLQGLPLLTFSTTPFEPRDLLVKRAFDLCGSAFLLLLTAPLFLLVALAVKLTSPGPVLFRQVRSGANGRPFVMYKFRSMCEDAEVLLAGLASANEVGGPVFKIKNDPRLTPIGRFLRRASVDELPQLWNVLRGDMSLVGPRPPIPSEVMRYESWQRRRLSMKPGLTCLWQISGRSQIVDFDQWMRLDLQYIDSWSLSLDARILAKTLPAVLTGRGAA
jgi:exopolysaccharide biosynthesis polyprenyl glycosylphosphotransferase